MSKTHKHTAHLPHRPHQPQKPAKNRWLIINMLAAFGLILIGVGVLFWMGQESAGKPASAAPAGLPQKGQTAPDFSLMSLDGAPVKLSDYSGQVVLVNTWATWCPPCKAEMPTIHNYYQAHKDEGFVVLAVNSQETSGTVSSFIEANQFTFPVLLDSAGQMEDQYSIRALPTSLVIDRNGVIQYIHTGEISNDQLELVINPLLKG
ncbi:MAG: alkyl hydroperoxide reductase [Chloroflexi bacterium]|nr:MAG: alkyl hydroperoxide reductase [Chloroflexota bacterium]